MTLYMVEIAAADFDASVTWYRDVLQLVVELIDERNRFALLRGESGGRLAIKQGVPVRDGVRLHFLVPDLVAALDRLHELRIAIEEPPKASSEGYRRAVILDPDGNPISLFEWTSPTDG